MQLLEFKKKIFTSLIKMNHFTLSTVKSKRIELRNSACWHLIAFLQSFLMVTDFHMFLRMIWLQFKKTWRTLILSKIVSTTLAEIPTINEINHLSIVEIFSLVNATLEAAMSVSRSVGWSVTFLKYSLILHFKGTLGYFKVH